jgi:beta-ureidopropionase / N-carbamoyl-L-amino-acid hydrolase
MPLNRRELLSSLAAAIAASTVADMSFAQGIPVVRINADRLQQSLEGLSVYGRPADGTFADGVSRVAYSDFDVAGRKYAMGLMRAAGLEPQIDAAGNITAFRAGSDASLKPVLFGAHIDSVPGGGNFDGDLGSVAAIEVMHTLKDHTVITRHPLRTVIWQNEEGGLEGSRAALGDPLDFERQYNGIRLAEGIRKIGGDPTKIEDARMAPGSTPNSFRIASFSLCDPV